MGETAQTREGETPRSRAGAMELADLAAESVIVYDPDGVISYWNPASERLYGWDAAATVGKHFSVFLSPRIAYADHWSALLEKGLWEGTVRRKTAAGRLFYAYVRQTVRRDHHGALIDIVEYGRMVAPQTAGISHDAGANRATERVQTQAQLRKLQLDHERAARISTLGKLTACIAHEVKQPLAAIVTNAETSLRWMAKEDINIEKVRHLTSRIISSAMRASEIVQRVQRMAAKSEVMRVPLHFADVVGEAVSFVRDDIHAKEITLDIGVEPDLPVVLGDRVQLQQVIVNLLINSIQAISQARSERRIIHLAISAPASRGSVVISVHDSGPGISEDNLMHIFESFFTTKAGGMGIGLALCQSIATEHGGQIQASNHPDGGALFQLSLPAALTDHSLGDD